MKSIPDSARSEQQITILTAAKPLRKSFKKDGNRWVPLKIRFPELFTWRVAEIGDDDRWLRQVAKDPCSAAVLGAPIDSWVPKSGNHGAAPATKQRSAKCRGF